jgi:hypothetical protein
MNSIINNILNLRVFFISCTVVLALTACSDSSNDQAAKSDSAAPAAQAPAHPPMQQNMQQGQKPLSAAQQAAIAAARDLPKEGMVLEMMHAAGYTYMQVDVGADSPMWIAASMMRVKPQQKVQWSDAAVMKNFKSKSLHRTFDQILFVSNAQVME